MKSNDRMRLFGHTLTRRGENVYLAASLFALFAAYVIIDNILAIVLS